VHSDWWVTIQSARLSLDQLKNAWGVVETGDGELGQYVDIGTWRASVEKYTFRILGKVTFDNELKKKTTDSVVKDSLKNASDTVTNLKPQI
jgi:hypothetical protein